YDIKTLDETRHELSYQDFEIFAKFEIITTLMKNKLALEPNTFIYDLSNPAENKMEILEINALVLDSVSDMELKWLSKFIDINNLYELTLRYQISFGIKKNTFFGFNSLQTLTLFGPAYNVENFLENLSNLKSLTLSHWQFSKFEPNFFQGLPNLKYLTFINTGLSHVKKDTFSLLKSLEYLSIKHCKVDILEEECLNGLDNLIKLEIETRKMYEEGFKTPNINFDNVSLSNLKKLKYLRLSDFLITQINFINNFENLEALDLLKIKLNHDAFDHMNLSNLKYFKFTSDKVPIFNESFKELQAIDGEVSVWSDDIQNRFSNLKKLDYLKLRIESVELDPKQTFQFIENLQIFYLYFLKTPPKKFLNFFKNLYFEPDKAEKYQFNESIISFEKILEKEYFENFIELSPDVRKELVTTMDRFFNKRPFS
ncbi:unnamed protein product, partial [Brachionus calyciflorus]